MSNPRTVLNKFFSITVTGLFLLQLSHNFLANFCDTIPVNADASKYLSTSISSNLSIVFNELLVWIVDNTKCPVIEALTAIWAVSESLISPIIITLGSCLKILLRTVAKSSPISLLTWTWLTPLISISTGSSTVIKLDPSTFNFWRKEYRVVDLPVPVAPVTNIIPLGKFNIFNILL